MKLTLILLSALLLAECRPNPQPVRLASTTPPVATETPFRASAWFLYKPLPNITALENAALAAYSPHKAWAPESEWANCKPGQTVVRMSTDEFNELGTAGRHLERLPER